MFAAFVFDILFDPFLLFFAFFAVFAQQYQTKDSKERRFCATIFAICSFRLPTFGACMARALLPKKEVDVPVAGWNRKAINLHCLNQRCATQFDERIEKAEQQQGEQEEDEQEQQQQREQQQQQQQTQQSKMQMLRCRSKVHGVTMLHDPATMMMDWRYCDQVLSQHIRTKKEYIRQNQMLPRSCFDPEYVDAITDEAEEREKRNIEIEQIKNNIQQEDKEGKEEQKETTTSPRTKKAKKAKKGKLIKKTKSILEGLRAAPVDVKLNLNDFNEDITQYRKAVNLQLALKHDQSWILR